MTTRKPINTRWLTDNWPWWTAFFFLLVYEFWALGTGQRTLSRMVWRSAIEYPWMIPIALSVVSWLLIHFFITKGNWAVELTWTAVIVIVIWIAYVAFQRKEELTWLNLSPYKQALTTSLTQSNTLNTSMT